MAGIKSKGTHRFPWWEGLIYLLVLLVASELLIALQSLIGTALGTGSDNSAQWVQFAPALGVVAVIVYRRFTGRDSTDLLDSVRANGVVWRRVITGIIAAAVGVLGWLLIMRALGVTDRIFTPVDEGGALPTILIWTLLGSFGEEFGWRAYLQPKLQNRLGFWLGTASAGLFWGAWHIQIFTQAPLFVLGFLTTTVALSFIMAFLIRGQKIGSLWIAGSVHASFDLLGYLRGPGAGTGPAEQWLQALVVVAVAVVVGLLTRTIISDNDHTQSRAGRVIE
ncbi:CPBP family intramembrane glutamic endopeptidase [Spelaeicoccus albus]|uniref:Membrane protease YdiL (CAAX protease family) n=1 Tax=Spelaeicoccus albus TaxID=1280376 RepID=A0A7Z0D138_9MICO|nr:type II CAAX endopeptidase family protein [Spelaeicoccus albus]NYI66278.1 membrane protease YdiL (CAAX protease family) [Spelaeicoccus albus]